MRRAIGRCGGKSARFLVTSQAPLRLHAEHVVRLAHEARVSSGVIQLSANVHEVVAHLVHGMHSHPSQ